MNRAVLGYALIALTIIGTLLAFSNAHNYVPRMGLAYNLQHAALFPGPKPDNSLLDACLAKIRGIDPARQLACRQTFPQQFRQYHTSLGVGLSVLAAIALLGLGLVAFGRGGSVSTQPQE